MDKVRRLFEYIDSKNLKISFELLVCDVSNIPSHLTARSSDAWLICDSYTINDMARDAGTIPYEILTDINYKSPRIEVIYKD